MPLQSRPITAMWANMELGLAGWMASSWPIIDSTLPSSTVTSGRTLRLRPPPRAPWQAARAMCPAINARGSVPKPAYGYVVFGNGTPLSWASKKEKIVPQSSAEAETYALNAGCKPLMFVKNMLAVLAPTQRTRMTRRLTDDGDSNGGLPAVEASAAGGHAKISFERYKTTMQASFMRKFAPGSHVFRRGDPVDHFYVITRGRCDVLVPKAENAENPYTKSAPPLQSMPTTNAARAALQDDDGSTSAVGTVDENGDVVIATLGPYERRSAACQNTDGVIRFESEQPGKEGYYEQLEEIRARMPEEPTLQYDIFIHVYVSTPLGDRRIGYVRYATGPFLRDIEDGKENPKPMWVLLLPDPLYRDELDIVSAMLQFTVAFGPEKYIAAQPRTRTAPRNYPRPTETPSDGTRVPHAVADCSICSKYVRSLL